MLRSCLTAVAGVPIDLGAETKAADNALADNNMEDEELVTTEDLKATQEQVVVVIEKRIV